MHPGQIYGQNVAGIRPLAGALQDFHKARQKATMEALMGRLRGRSLELLSYNEVAEMLKVRGRSERGIKEIPVTAIVGSVGRYHDFSRSFLPRHDADAQRWAGVRAAGHVADLPPIDVYQIGDAYFVLDGNHRVSIARQVGLDYIHANVIEVHTRVPLPPDIQPDELIIRAEYAAFLDYTRLDDLRPGCDLQVTAPGQYNRLENHMEVHRFFVEMAEERDLPDAEAFGRWYDEAYLPLVQAIREQGILRDFPRRTETDLYLWLATHQAELRNELGWQVRPNTAVTQFAAHLKPRRTWQRVLDVMVPANWKGKPAASDWAQERLLDRYSSALFAEILLPLTGRQEAARQEAALAQAIAIAQREHGRLIGLFLGDENKSLTRAWFERACAAADVTAVWGSEQGSLPEVIARRAALADLVIMDKTAADTAVTTIWQNCTRPVLLPGHRPSAMNRVLLVCSQNREATIHKETALFAAAYLAEQWGSQLVVGGSPDSLSLARAYLEMHEVNAEFVSVLGNVDTAVLSGCDLVVLGRHGRFTTQLLPLLTVPVLICP
ncbi:MAG: hypothetical protein HND44_17830 [Chloroflexi bacterium]|nr:hypothetical protein [Ardenticatenaceae bacterium]MBL1130316.1 hypothetical protein [Chloroflexota bacterium]NOG36407.1 hypothetical protein [Chloroflexota bacterium]GIK57290.1 MAG: universal stress protein UspA [Chloroflexota bacterium]